MAKIKLTVINENASATLLEGPLVGRAPNVQLDVSVSGEMWDGLGLSLVASCNGVERDAPIVDGMAIVPWECMIYGYHLRVGIRGSDGENPNVYTVFDDAGIVLRSTGNAKTAPSVQPTPSLVDQIMAAFGKVVDAWTDTKDKIATIWTAYLRGDLKGEQGDPGPEGPAGPAGPAYDDKAIKQDLSKLKNTTETSVGAGKVWTSTTDGAGWEDPQGGVTDDHINDLIDAKVGTLEPLARSILEGF